MSKKTAHEQSERIFEFAIEHGFGFDFIEVRACNAVWAREKLRDVMTLQQRESATSIELCSEGPV